MVVAAASIPLAQLFVRADLAFKVGWQDVGYWQSIARLSDAYMQVFAVLCINLLLPQLSRSARAMRVNLLGRLGRIFIALFLFGAASLYVSARQRRADRLFRGIPAGDGVCRAAARRRSG